MSIWVNKDTKLIVQGISGKTAPQGKRMGHAGAIVSGASGTAKSKIEAMKDGGILVAERLSDLIPILKDVISKNEKL